MLLHIFFISSIIISSHTQLLSSSNQYDPMTAMMMNDPLIASSLLQNQQMGMGGMNSMYGGMSPYGMNGYGIQSGFPRYSPQIAMGSPMGYGTMGYGSQMMGYGNSLYGNTMYGNRGLYPYGMRPFNAASKKI